MNIVNITLFNTKKNKLYSHCSIIYVRKVILKSLIKTYIRFHDISKDVIHFKSLLIWPNHESVLFSFLNKLDIYLHIVMSMIVVIL